MSEQYNPELLLEALPKTPAGEYEFTHNVATGHEGTESHTEVVFVHPQDHDEDGAESQQGFDIVGH